MAGVPQVRLRLRVATTPCPRPLQVRVYKRVGWLVQRLEQRGLP